MLLKFDDVPYDTSHSSAEGRLHIVDLHSWMHGHITEKWTNECRLHYDSLQLRATVMNSWSMWTWSVD